MTTKEGTKEEESTSEANQCDTRCEYLPGRVFGERLMFLLSHMEDISRHLHYLKFSVQAANSTEARAAETELAEAEKAFAYKFSRFVPRFWPGPFVDARNPNLERLNTALLDYLTAIRLAHCVEVPKSLEKKLGQVPRARHVLYNMLTETRTTCLALIDEVGYPEWVPY